MIGKSTISEFWQCCSALGVLAGLLLFGTAPTLGQGGQLGPAYDGWSLSGGEILRYYGSPSEQSCRRDCTDSLTCQAYTWVKPGGYQPGDGPICYLMRSFQGASRHRCCIAATRGPFPGTTVTGRTLAPTAAAISVASVFRRYDLFGTWAPDCTQPANAQNQYVMYRLDGDSVKRETTSANTNPTDMRFIDNADALQPNELLVSLAGQGPHITLTIFVERDRHRLWAMMLDNRTLVAKGRRTGDAMEMPWLNRCGR